MSDFDPPVPHETAKPPRWRHPVVLAAASIAALVLVLAAIGAIRHKPAAPAPALATVTVGDAPAAAPGAALATAPKPPPRIGMRPAFAPDAPMRAGARLAWDNAKTGIFTLPDATDESAWLPRAARTVAAGGEIDFTQAPRGGAPREFARGTLTGFVQIESDGKYTLRADAENASTFRCFASLGGVKFASLDWRATTDGQTLPLQAGFHAVSLSCAAMLGGGGAARLSILPEGNDTPTPMQLFLPAPTPAPAPKKADVLAGDPETPKP